MFFFFLNYGLQSPHHSSLYHIPNFLPFFSNVVRRATLTPRGVMLFFWFYFGSVYSYLLFMWATFYLYTFIRQLAFQVPLNLSLCLGRTLNSMWVDVCVVDCWRGRLMIDARAPDHDSFMRVGGTREALRWKVPEQVRPQGRVEKQC